MFDIGHTVITGVRRRGVWRRYGSAVNVVIMKNEDGAYAGAQGGIFSAGVSRESAGSERLCLHRVFIAAGTETRAHTHDGHESAIYVLAGRHQIRYGDRLQHLADLEPGDMVYIPPGMPHQPIVGDEDVTALVARTDPAEQESLRLHAPEAHYETAAAAPHH